MLQENKAPFSSVFNMISKLQRGLFYAILFIIPWFVIPLPYDSTEQIKSIVFILLSSFVILLEVIKWIWDGKISVIKSGFDKVFLALFASFFLSFVFAKDTWIALWGYNGRMGTGFLVMIFLFIFFYLSRGFLQKKKEIVNAVIALSTGLFVLILLSLLSVLKINVLGWIPYVKNFFVVGLPLTFSFQEIMLLAGGSVFINIFLVTYYALEKKYQLVIYPVIALVLSLIAIPLFSVNQGALIPVVFLVITILLCLLLFLKLDKSLKAIPILVFILSALVIVFSIGFQYESFRKSILGDSFTIINPVRLGADISWIVASSSIVMDFFRGLVGIGNDSFGIAYHWFRPQETVSLGNSLFLVGANEVFTTLANRGLIGVIAWLLVGFTFFKILIKEVTSSSKEKSLLSSILGLSAVLIFVSSFFFPFSFLTYFVFFVITLLLLVYISKDDNNEEFLVKFWAVNVGSISKDINKTVENINWFFTILITLVTTTGVIFLLVKSVSVAYVVRAESYTVEVNTQYQDYQGEIPIDERDSYLNRMAGYYDKALGYDASNPYIKSRASVIALQKVNILSEKYTEASEDDKKTISSEMAIWKNMSIDLSREATTTTPFTYSFWNTRALVYLELMGAGLSDYSEEALAALQSCLNLNPYDFEAYYRAGQLYMMKEDYPTALANFNKVLGINGQHIDSLMLGAVILKEQGEVASAISYLEAAQKILETNEETSSDRYNSIVENIAAWKELAGVNEEEAVEETEAVEGEELDITQEED